MHVFGFGEWVVVVEYDCFGVFGHRCVVHGLDLFDVLVERFGRLCVDRVFGC